jgi:hypothetical protein
MACHEPPSIADPTPHKYPTVSDIAAGAKKLLGLAALAAASFSEGANGVPRRPEWSVGRVG